MKLKTIIAVGLGFLVIAGCAPSRTDLFQSGNSEARVSKLDRKVKSTAGAGGASGNSSSVITEIYATDKCQAVSRGGFIWLTDQVVLEDLLTPLGAEAATEITTKVNFDLQGVLMVDFGTTPTPAYRVKLMQDKLQLDGPKAMVQVDLVKPAADKKMVQVVSHPCALYAMPRLGYTTLEVQSGLGDVFTTFSN